MRLRHLSSTLPPRLWRGVATFAAGLVLLLSASGVSPELHSWLHDGEPEEQAHPCAQYAAQTADHSSPAPDSDEREEHQCAVTIFSHGVVHHALAQLAQPCEGLLRAVNYRAFERLALARPHHLRPLPQAPPAV